MPTPVAIPVTEITRAGVVPPAATTGDVTNGHTFVNDGQSYITIDNSSGSTGTVTIAIAQLVDGQAPASKTYTVPLSSTGYHIGPFPPSIYGSTVALTVSAATLTLRAWHLSDTG